MTSFNVETLLSGHVFGFLLLFCRIGGVIMLFPGIGESYVPPRSRLLFAFMVCLLLLEPMLPRLPALPASPAEMTRMIAFEVIIGLFFGTLIRLAASALESTGMIIGIQTGLSNATVMNPALAIQSPLPSALLSTLGLTLIFVSGLDHFLIRSMIGLYDIFPAGGDLIPGDMAKTVIHATNGSFVMGIELATPFIVMGLLFYTALGIIQRLLPNVQLFIVSLPIEIWGGLVMFALTLTGIMTIWLRYVDQSVADFFRG